MGWRRWDAKISALVALALAACGGGSGNECAECMDEKCADLIEICRQDTSCACMVECTGENGIGGVEACLGTCSVTARPDGFAQVEECAAVACPDSGDECATPSDWTPPGDEVTCDGSGTGSLGGGALADCSFDPGMAFDPDGAVLQLEGVSEELCVRIERRDEGSGTLANTEWTLLELRVGPPGEVALVESEADLCWYSSHHNFRDWAHAWSGMRHFDLVIKEDGHGGPRSYQLYVFEEGPIDPATCAPTANGSTCIAGPIDLAPVNP